MKKFMYCPCCAKPLQKKEIEQKRRLACPDETCGYIFYNNPTPVVAGLVEWNGSIILARNKGWPSDWFGLVAGFLEKGESPQEGILREVSEELGLSGTIASFIGVYGFPEMNQVIIAYHIMATGTISLGEELEEYKAVLPENLKPWPIGTGHAVKDWLQQKGLLQHIKE